MVRESKSSRSTPIFCVKKLMVSGVLCMLITSLMRLRLRHRHPFLESMFFKTTWQDVQCTVHSTWSMVIINCSCKQVISPIQVLQAVCFGSGWLCPRGFPFSLATFHCLVTQLFRPHRPYAQTNFDDIFVHSRAEQGRSDVG